MYKLPFRVYDGKVTRPCTYEDLWIMHEFILPYMTYSNRRKFYIWREFIPNDVVEILYVCLKALKDTSNALPYNYLGTVTYVDRSRIGIIKCKELYKWKGNKLAHLLMTLE